MFYNEYLFGKELTRIDLHLVCQIKIAVKFPQIERIEFSLKLKFIWILFYIIDETILSNSVRHLKKKFCDFIQKQFLSIELKVFVLRIHLWLFDVMMFCTFLFYD